MSLNLSLKYSLEEGLQLSFSIVSVSIQGTWQTEKGNPVSLCTEENVEPRLVVYGNQSWWSVGSHEHQNVPGSDKQRSDDTGQRAAVQEEILLVLILLLALVLSNLHCDSLQ